MTPNPSEFNERPEPGPGPKPHFSPGPFAKDTDESCVWKICLSTSSMLARILIGAVFGVTMFFAFRGGVPLNGTSTHIVLCVIGYHILMAEAILSMSSSGGWMASIKPLHRKRAHAVMQITGSILAIIGSFYKMLDKEENFNTTHGIFGLIALIFTTVSLVNGLASFYAYELRKILPGKLSKTTHICFGIVAFVAASVCLCLGIDKAGFRIWVTTAYADTLIAFVAIFVFIIIINPCVSFVQKLRS